METPPGPSDTIIKRPPITDNVWQMNWKMHIRKNRIAFGMMLCMRTFDKNLPGRSRTSRSLAVVCVMESTTRHCSTNSKWSTTTPKPTRTTLFCSQWLRVPSEWNRRCLGSPATPTTRIATEWWTWTQAKCDRSIEGCFSVCFHQETEHRQTDFVLRHVIQPTPATERQSMRNYATRNEYPIESNTQLSAVRR